MLRKSLIDSEKIVALSPKDKKKCVYIANCIIVQCTAVFVAAATILQCVWSPDHATLDYDKLARIMYLYDPLACGYECLSSRTIAQLHLSNQTQGLDVLPIKWQAAIVTVSTRLSAKTRRYIELSVVIHFVWLIVAIALRIFASTTTKLRFLKIVLTVFFYTSVFVLVFDSSMAIVYVAHIQQSLTKGMIVRYSGWSIEMKLKNYDDFAGWLPIMASVCWMRGLIFFALNMYCCKIIRRITARLRKREVKKRLLSEGNLPIPDPQYDQPPNDKVLYYRTGETQPYVRKEFSPRIFY